MEALALVVLSSAVLIYAVLSNRAEDWILTPPMVAAISGLLLGRFGLEVVPVQLDRGFINSLAEVTLVLTLFTDASRIDLRRLRREHHLPLRLLGVGLPLAVLAGWAAALLLLPGLTALEAAILAIILAPTDAALGQAVVSNTQVPGRIRQALNVESGLNDGLALPALLIFIALFAKESQSMSHWLGVVALQLSLGPVVGASVGYLGARLVDHASRRGWVNETFLQITVLALAVLAFGAAELTGGNGFIAAFVAGLAVGTASHELKAPLHQFGEAEGQLLGLATFFIFGASLIPVGLSSLGLREVLYAAGSLTVVRLVPVWLSTMGAHVRPTTRAFIGWFGPRGLASIIYLLIVHEEGLVQLHSRLFSVVTATVALSIVAHGVTAAPLALRYSRHMARLGPQQAPGEHASVHQFPVRLPWRKAAPKTKDA